MGQSQFLFEKEISKAMELKYLLYIPEEYNSSQESWPLMLFLHGASKRGDDLKLVEKQGPPKLIVEENQRFPFIILSPQCPKNRWWDDELRLDMIDALLNEVTSQYRVDKNRIYVTGLSMGGAATWRLATIYPERFAAIAPICGFGNPEDAPLIANLPIWVFHGAKDPTILITESEKMVEALKKENSNAKFTVYPDAGHDSWTETYDNPELYDWFLSHSRH